MTQTSPAAVSTCPDCGQETVFDPGACPWVLVARPDGRGGMERLLYRRVRCAK